MGLFLREHDFALMATVLCGCGKWVTFKADATEFSCACGRKWRAREDVASVTIVEFRGFLVPDWEQGYVYLK